MVVVVVMVVVMMVLMLVVVMVMQVSAALHLLYPRGRGGHLVEVEETSVEYAVEIHIAVVASDNLGLWLQGADNLARAAQLFGRHLGGLVE